MIIPEPISEENTDIVAAFTSSKRRLLIVGEPGSGKTTAAYDVIEHLDETEGDERVALLVNLSAWEAQENFEAFLVDYLVSEVGYQVRQPAVASAFIQSRRYPLVLDGLDEIAAGLRTHFSECLDEFVRRLPSEIAVVVTCRTQEYKELFAAHPTGLGLVQAVEILPLTSQQLDSAFVELVKYDDKDWETLLSQQRFEASQRARDLLSNPLFLNLAIAGRLRPRELLDRDDKQELRDLVLERYLDRALLADQSAYEPRDLRRYLTWIARFLNGIEVSPFGLKTTDFTVFDLANLTPPDPPRRYRLFKALFWGLFFGLGYGLFLKLSGVYGLGEGLQTMGHMVIAGLHRGVAFGLFGALVLGMIGGLVFGLVFVLVGGLVETRSVLITSRTPKEASSRSLIAALFWVVVGVVMGLVVGVAMGLIEGGLLLGELLLQTLSFGLASGLIVGAVLGLRSGGRFVLLQKVAHRRLARAGNLPPRPADFLEWGIERQIFRRVGGGVRFRHSLIQQHLANT